MINTTLLIFYSLIFLFLIFYLNKDKLKSFFIGFKKSDKEKYAKICPKCGSINIKTDFSNPVVWAYGTSPKYKCKECGYLSFLFPEVIPEKIGFFRNKIKKGMKISYKQSKYETLDVSSGFYVGIFEVFIVISIFIIIIAFMAYYEDPLARVLFIIFFFFIVVALVQRFRRKIYKNSKSF